MAAKRSATAPAQTKKGGGKATPPSSPSAPTGAAAQLSVTTTGAPEANVAGLPPPVVVAHAPFTGDENVTNIRVAARCQAGFRRAGRFWPQAETCLPLSELTQAQVEALVTESELDVSFYAEDKA